ncbi:MAG TPA: hypothetical protein VH438_08195 [Gemmatimonadales bacterium]|jgi:translation initiation factor IF-1
MNPYTFCLILGAVGLGAMAFSGLGSHLHLPGHGAGHGGHGGHAGHSEGHAHSGHDIGSHGHIPAPAHHHGTDVSRSLVTFLSPRLLFGWLLGFGAAGLLLRSFLSGPLLALAAVVGGVAFEVLAAGPVSRFFFRFASKPAATLESCIEDEVRALTGFDSNGQGLVAVELDGQIVQVLATLSDKERAAGVRVRSGDRLRVQEVDAARNRCTVSAL